MVGYYPHWFVDRDRDMAGMWTVCLETGDGWIPQLRVWFRTEEEAKDFMFTYLKGAEVDL